MCDGSFQINTPRLPLKTHLCVSVVVRVMYEYVMIQIKSCKARKQVKRRCNMHLACVTAVKNTATDGNKIDDIFEV